jgi:hypothetical protein
MRMKFGIKVATVGAVAVLAIAGIAYVLMTQNGGNDGYSVANSAPLVSVQSTADEDAVLVTAMVDGNSVPMSDVQVRICKMNASTDGNQMTMRVMECVSLQTNADGKVAYQFQDGEKYMICAENQNQQGYANMNMNETESQMCYEHEWSWQSMEGQSFGYASSNQGSGKA